METLMLSEVAKACGGTFNKECEITNICIDTRKIVEGCLFICIKGENFDAHRFAQEALDKGAAAVMVHKDIELDGCIVQVENTSKALLALGGYYRSKFDIPVVALTGSVGKTTTKEFTYLVVNSKYNAIKTLGNLNNEIGLPQMLFQINSSIEAAVIEMGMNHFGEIHNLTTATQPTIALITNIGVSHIENLGSREGILKAKLEILDGLKKGSTLILNGDNDLLSTVKNDDYNIAFYGINNGDFKAEDIVEANGETTFTISYFGKSQQITIPTIGEHNVYNALSAFAVGYYLDIEPDQCAQALSAYQPEGMRQKIVELEDIICIEDCYNASPDSMKAALKTLANTKGDRKIAVLADMLELGAYAETAHTQVGEMVFDNSIDYLMAYGDMAKYIVSTAKSKGMTNAYHFDTKEALSDELIKLVKSGDTVMFKASRGMKLEDIINKLYEVK